MTAANNGSADATTARQTGMSKEKKKEHVEHKRESEREIPDVSDMRAIKLISQHVYTKELPLYTI